MVKKDDKEVKREEKEAKKEEKQQEKEKVTAERTKALELALAHIEKQFGKGSIMKLGDESHAKVEFIPTGALSLDMAIGVGGIPRGRVIEIYGPESS